VIDAYVLLVALLIVSGADGLYTSVGAGQVRRWSSLPNGVVGDKSQYRPPLRNRVITERMVGQPETDSLQAKLSPPVSTAHTHALPIPTQGIVAKIKIDSTSI